MAAIEWNRKNQQLDYPKYWFGFQTFTLKFTNETKLGNLIFELNGSCDWAEPLRGQRKRHETTRLLDWPCHRDSFLCCCCFFSFLFHCFFFTIISFSFFFFNFRCDHRWTLHWLPWSESHSPTLSVFSVIKLSTTVSHRSARTPKMSRIKKKPMKLGKILGFVLFFFLSWSWRGNGFIFIFWSCIFNVSFL